MAIAWSACPSLMSWRQILIGGLFGALAAGAMAQRTWIVDLNNRPGTDFTDLPAAVAAAAPGDILRVRTQSSLAFYTSPGNQADLTKPLQILGESSVSRPKIARSWRVRNIPSGSFFLLANVELVSQVTFSASNCQGQVMLEGIRLALANCEGGINFTDCVLGVVSHADLQVRAGVGAWNSTVMIDGSQIRCFNYPPAGIYQTPDGFIYSDVTTQGRGGLAAVTATNNGRVYVSGSTLIGASATMAQYGFNSHPALYLSGAAVTIQKGCTLSAGNDYGGGPSHINLGYPTDGTNSSRLYADPGTIVNSIWRPDRVHTFEQSPQTGLTYQVTPTTLQVNHLANPLSTCVLAMGSLTSPWTAPSIGPVCIDPAGASEFWSPAPASGTVTTIFAIPPGLPLGYQLALQCFELLPSGAIKTSNAAVAGIR